ncbi:hypothetical protein [Rhodococcus sp. Leaf233]|nr:hypothetical protein [Rhodococcus sp. Leaf233]
MISLLAVSGGAAALRALGSTFNYAELRIVVGIHSPDDRRTAARS